MDKSDREAIEFAKMQQSAYGCAGMIFIAFFVVYGILRLFGVDDAEIIAYLVRIGVLLPK